MKEFYAQLDTAAQRLEQAYLHLSDEGQLEQYRIQVHAMKSLAGTVGIVTLFGMARVLEYAARDGKTEAILAMTPVFLEEWYTYPEQIGADIQALLEAVTNLDVEEVQRIAERLSEEMADGVWGD